jgi:hypothetical protein
VIEIVDVLGDRHEAILDACVEDGEAKFDASAPLCTKCEHSSQKSGYGASIWVRRAAAI